MREKQVLLDEIGALKKQLDSVVFLDRAPLEVIPANLIGIPEESPIGVFDPQPHENPDGLLFNSEDIAVNSTKNSNFAISTINITPIVRLKKRQYPQRLPKSIPSPNPLLTSTLHISTYYPLSTSTFSTQSTTPTTPIPPVIVAANRGKKEKEESS